MACVREFGLAWLLFGQVSDSKQPDSRGLIGLQMRRANHAKLKQIRSFWEHQGKIQEFESANHESWAALAGCK